MFLLAGHGIGHQGRPAGEQLCCEGWRHDPAATGRARQQNAPSAPSAWDTLRMQPTWLPASSHSALPVSRTGPEAELGARFAGSLLTCSCIQCKQTMTTRSMWSPCPPTTGRMQSERGSGADAHSGMTTCTARLLTTPPLLAEGGLWGATKRRGREQLWGSPPSRLLQPTLLGSEPH